MATPLAYNLGPRPPRLFLVWLELAAQPMYVAWKVDTHVRWVHAGFERIVEPSISSRPSDPSEPTVQSVERDFRVDFNLQPGEPLRVWDISDLLGYYHPRIHRPEIYRAQIELEMPAHSATDLAAAVTSSVASAQLLFDQLDEILAVVEPLTVHRDVFGHRLRQLLLLACMDVESALKSVLAANGRSGQSMTDYVRLAEPMRLSGWTVRLTRSTEELLLTPFEFWSPPTPSPPSKVNPPWYAAYNSTKHGRETHLNVATLGHTLNAIAAVYVLLLAQFGPNVIERLRHRPFEVLCAPEWAPGECYVLSPFAEPEWQARNCF